MRKWQLKEDDVIQAKQYLIRKIKLDTNYMMLDYKELFKIKDVTLLQEWINKNLDKKQIDNLRASLRVGKSRNKKQLMQITVQRDIGYKLSDFARCNNITISKAIELLLNLQDETLFQR